MHAALSMDAPRRQLLAAATAAALIAAIGMVAVVTGRLVLFASLGPTAVMQAHSPQQQSSRTYNVIVGHFLGVALACLTVIVLGLDTAPSVFELRRVTLLRSFAAAVSIGTATTAELRLNATHPPAASTTLLFALGSFHPTLRDIASVASGVALVGGLGKAARVAMNRGRR